jgi:hypothetical protein
MVPLPGTGASARPLALKSHHSPTSAAAMHSAQRLPAHAPALSTTTALCLPPTSPATSFATVFTRDPCLCSACAVGRGEEERGRSAGQELSNKTTAALSATSGKRGQYFKGRSPVGLPLVCALLGYHFPSPPTSKPPQPFMAITTVCVATPPPPPTYSSPRAIRLFAP